MLPRALVFAAALAATTSFATSVRAEAPTEDAGFNDQSIARFMEQHHGDAAASPWSRLSDTQQARMRGLLAAAEGFRRLGVTDLATLRADLSPAGRARLAALLGNADDAPIAHLWQFFLEDSLIYIGNGLAETSRAGFYNPELDAWLLADWRQLRDGESAPRLELVALRAVTGDTMRGVKPTGTLPVAYWVRLRARGLAVPLAVSHRVNVAAFAARFPLMGTSAPQNLPDETGAVELRITAAALALTGLANSPDLNAAVQNLQSALAAGDAAALKALAPSNRALPAEHIAGISSIIRQMLRPCGVYRRADGVSVMLSAPFSGRFVLVADYDKAAKPTLQSLAFVDLTAIEPQ